MISTIVEIEKIEDFIEQGFYSKAYLAKDKRLDRLVAVKDFIYKDISSEEDFEHFFEEAYKLSLASHPRVLPVYYVGIDKTDSDNVTPRIVTHFFKNGSLNGYLESVEGSGRSLPLDQGLRFAHDIIQGMIHLHSLDIAHLDLKASNIFIGDDGKLILADFGHAKFLKEGVILDAKPIYPAIQPKEQRTKKVVDKTADIYQFGMLLFSIFCYKQYRKAIDVDYKISNTHLKKIFRDKAEDVADEKKAFFENVKRYQNDVRDGNFPKPEDFSLIIPKQLKAIVSRCLEPQVTNRYNNFYEIQHDLNEIAYPKGISNYHFDPASNTVHFTKDTKPCELLIQESDGKYNVTAKKNNRNVNTCAATNVTNVKIAKQLFKLASEI